MDRLAELSEDLHSAFEPPSKTHWSTVSPGRHLILREAANETSPNAWKLRGVI